MPVRIDGRERGIITVSRILISEDPRVRAARMASLSTPFTPVAIFNRTGKKTTMEIKRIGRVGRRPIQMISNGSHAIPGIGKSRLIIGLKILSNTSTRPIKKPMGMAKTRPKRIPAKTLKRLSPTDFRRRPLFKSSYPTTNTFEGGGKRKGGKRLLLARPSQIKKNKRIETRLHFKWVTFIRSLLR